MKFSDHEQGAGGTICLLHLLCTSSLPKSGRTSERDRYLGSGDQPNVKPVVLYPRAIVLARISIDIESASTQTQ